MSARRWLEIACLLVILGGVGLKIALSRQEAERHPAPLAAEMADFLKRQGFTLTGTDTNLDLVLIHARRPPGCVLTLALMAPQGWHGGVVRSLVEPGEELFFVFDGVTYAEQPVLRSRFRLYWTLLLRRLGLEAPLHPLFGVVARPACSGRELPWQDVSRVSADAAGG